LFDEEAYYTKVNAVALKKVPGGGVYDQGPVMPGNVPVLDESLLPRKGLKRKYRSKKGAGAFFVRNWSGKPGFRRLAPEMRPKGLGLA
jgi:hypothetical protein